MENLVSQEWFYPADRSMAQMPRWEYHVHSDFSDGAASVSKTMAVARAKGIQRLIFTEHTEPELVADAGWFARYARTVRDLRRSEAGDMAVVLGLEVPILDLEGNLLATEEMLSESEFILGAVHAYPGYGWNLAGIDPALAIDLEFQGLLALIDHPRVHAIAHPGGVCGKYVTPFPMSLFEQVVVRAKARGKAIELNPAYHHPMAPFLEICRRHGVLLAPGSNAHHPDEIGLAWKVLQETEAQLWRKSGIIGKFT
ncbi:MAG: PHP domain-containing protein [Magnetococcales bacterium]|nr:PHP domain-containing protein [Magnetococcales bacterium]